MNKISTFVGACLATCAIAFAGQASAAVHLLNSTGALIGAKGVNVAGTLYDVTFEDGTCESIFSGCDAASDFAFNNAADATAAAAALLDQVFIDLGVNRFEDLRFDLRPGLTYGCTSTSSICLTYIPFELGSPTTATARTVYNWTFDDWDSIELRSIDRAKDFSTWGLETYAKFQLAATPVPEPTSMVLFGVALISMAFARRRKS